MSMSKLLILIAYAYRYGVCKSEQFSFHLNIDLNNPRMLAALLLTDGSFKTAGAATEKMKIIANELYALMAADRCTTSDHQHPVENALFLCE